tara:strand:- start:198 stop:695 length:498 start_codon:yes stop_codon:yes gene_type:complete
MKNLKIKFIKKFLRFSFILIVFGCNNQTDYSLITDKYSSEELLCVSLLNVDGVNILFGNPYTGSCLVYDGDLKIKTGLETYVNGKLEGINIGYYPDGVVDYIGYKSNGEINGDFVKFHQNGEIAIKGQFSDGLYVGWFKYYDESGKKIEQKRYNNLGVLIKTKKY